MKLLGVLLTVSKLCTSFNFDTDYAILYSNPLENDTTYGNKRNYFGYSTIMYAGNSGEADPWIQIGAPKAQDPEIFGIDSGMVFRCPIREKCDILRVDYDTENKAYNYYGRPYTNHKAGAWIGSVMDINVEMDRVIVCGFRWTSLVSLTDDSMQGACYWSEINGTRFRKLLPLVERKFFSINQNRRRLYFYAHGQSGFSAQITSSGNLPQLLMGAPGVFNWEGTSLIYSILTDTKTQDANIPNIEFSSYGLYGYAVTSGYFFGNGELLYVGSSPKKNHYLGQISVYTFNKLSHNRVLLKDSKQGSQMGEYFGASLAAGDINNDGYTDLFVGAPFYKGINYNEGRVHIFYGSAKGSFRQNDDMPVVNGKVTGGQFGTSIACLDDFDLDGFGDIAISAPYENENAGTVYIYRGKRNGLSPQPAQIIHGRNVYESLRGFGISLSKSSDIDRNGYHDIAVGAYLSGHATILRGKPIVSLRQSLTLQGADKFDVNENIVEICLWFEGSFLPNNIGVIRTIKVDENLRRATLEMSNDIEKEEILVREKINCKNYTIVIKKNAQNLEQPVNIKIIQRLTSTNSSKEPQIAGKKSNDGFCKTCAVMGSYQPLSIDIPFSLGCGEDNICESNLSFDTKFSSLFNDSSFIIGSSNTIKMTTKVFNHAELAYSAKLTIVMPKYVQLSFTPKACSESNGSTIVVCNIGNPIKSNDMVTLELTLNMKNIPNTLTELDFKVTVNTSSINRNGIVKKQYTLQLISQADFQLSGKSNQQSYSYGNKESESSVFSHIYQVQKVGKTPVDQVIINIHIPVSVYVLGKYVDFLKLYPHKAMLAGQPILCNNITFVDYINELTDTEESNEVDINGTSSSVLKQEEVTESPMLLKREIPDNINYSDHINQTIFEEISVAVTENDNSIQNTFLISCDNPDFTCTTIRCIAGPFKSEQHVGVIQIKAMLNVSILKGYFRKINVIQLRTFGNLTVSDFEQSGDLSDDAIVFSIFLGNIVTAPVETWIIVVSIVSGLLLFLILVLFLTKAGFFTRKKKAELEALKKAEIEQEFLSADHNDPSNEPS